MGKLHQLLQQMPIFGGVNPATLDFILERAPLVVKTESDCFFQEGDLAQAMYVLEKGRVAIFRSYRGVQYKLRELQQGDCFGEMALMACSARSASVCALGECHALEIESRSLAELYQHDPEQYTLIMMNMGREVCRRLNQADTRLFLYDVVKLPMPSLVAEAE